ncbi:hypothetical protein, partial [Leptospira sp. id769339]|uniref:hypothetical protein n=1 Tax=Leptospira sp. id769339 TaxID=2864221 RepID=UPI00214BBB2D
INKFICFGVGVAFYSKKSEILAKLRIFVSVLLVLSVSFDSTSCSDLDDLNPFNTVDDKGAMNNFIKL